MSASDGRDAAVVDDGTPPSSEYETLCQTLRDRLRIGAMPPDEAYWWTRVLVEEAVAVAHSWLPPGGPHKPSVAMRPSYRHDRKS
jgi:hypothetical protein